MKARWTVLWAVAAALALAGTSLAWTPVPVKNDPLVRMPGTQPAPENAPDIEAPTRCTNCHGGYDQAVEPTFNWQGSMMAQASRDFLFWACLTVAAQDSIWAIGTPNAVDLCERCHFPQGWVEGRSDPPNASLMTGSDYDGVHCDICHSQFDPFFQTTFGGTREGSDWSGYWDEAGTLSQPAANATYLDDQRLARGIKRFDGQLFFETNLTPPNYTEAASGQFFLDDSRDKRASFADANARHPMFYSRFHKSKYMCATCHDVSNPVLANLGLSGLANDGSGRLITEQYSAARYVHVERTFSEFMLSAYGQEGGASGIGPYAPTEFKTSRPGNVIATCQDCHMRDGVGKGASQNNAVVRPTGSTEHPQSGQPIHDLTGGNAWVSWVLASAVSGSPNYDAGNAALLNQGAAVLTLNLSQGLGIAPAALLAGADRAMQQLGLAAAIEELGYDPSTGVLSFKVQNQTGHKLISGFPEGRRMFLNIKAYQGANLLQEVNPYDYTAATLKGLDYPYQPGRGLPAPSALAANEVYRDDLVFEMKPSSTLTKEAKTFHFALADGRYKDNRIPPKGFRIDDAAERVSTPVYGGVDRLDLFTPAEYAGGYRAVALNLPAGADRVAVSLHYQTTSREYIEFLRDEINGTGNLTLAGMGAGGDPPYLAQTDPFFAKLRAWGNTIWDLWLRNRDVTTAAPYLMTQAVWGGTTPPPPPCTAPGTPGNVKATALRGQKVKVDWAAASPAPAGGYNVYYDQSGKLSLRATVPAGTLTYTDSGLAKNTTYCYVLKAWNDCNGNGLFDLGTDAESGPSTIVCATTANK